MPEGRGRLAAAFCAGLAAGLAGVAAAKALAAYGKKHGGGKLKLLYFGIKGKAEAIRLSAAHAGLPLEDYRFADRAEFNALKENGVLPFGQVPALEVAANAMHRSALVPQSAAILRYVARRAGTYPADDVTAALVDAALDQEADAFVGYTVARYTTRFGIELDEDGRARATKEWVTNVLPRHLANLESMLKRSPTPWIAGTPGPQPCDFAWACRLEQLRAGELYDVPPSALDPFPHCAALVDAVLALPAVQEWYAVPH